MELEQILLEEQELIFDYFDSELAYQIGSALVQYEKEFGLNLAIDMYACGKQVFHYAGNECIPDNDNWLRRKRNTVLHFGHSTMFVFQKQKGQQSQLSEKYGLSAQDYTITPGGFPIRIRNVGVIGALCISGLSPQEDHALCVKLLREFI